MSENVTKTPKAKKQGKFSIKKIFSNIARFFRELISEIKKIVWPSGRTVLNNTIVVLVVCLIVGAFIWVIDAGLGYAVSSLLQF